MMEARLQREVIRFLKAHGVYVIKTRPQPGTPVGCPDVIGLYKDRFVVIEVKASEKAPFRPGQLETLKYLKKGNKFVYCAYPENWLEIKAQLVARFF